MQPEAQETIQFEGAGLRLTADVAGPVNGQPIVLLHGGGQTRSSWKAALGSLARRGYRAYSVDLRGHGDSDWSADGDYGLDRFAEDVAAIARSLDQPPVFVGASMGGLSALLAVGELNAPAAGLVLVDVAPRLESSGAGKIGAFMRSAPNGFGSLDEAADAVAAYLPHRTRPKSSAGLAKNLRLRDGRLHWHWDPRFIEPGAHSTGTFRRERLDAAARALKVPTLLIRGGLSEVVSEAGAREFLAMAPGSEFVDVQGADHMVAGDANDAFNAAVIDFIDRRVKQTAA